jgi:D-cysteine desulfhydrase
VIMSPSSTRTKTTTEDPLATSDTTAPRPLERLVPAVASLARASLIAANRDGTPIERSDAAPALWIKRDDLSAPYLGGNKVRALEYLLGEVGPDDTVLTAGGLGSTHALSTVLHAHRLGAHAIVLRWSQEMNDAARSVAARLAREADSVRDSHTVAGTYLRAFRMRAMARVRGARWRWIPAGGTSPLGILGHVNAALELADQVHNGAMPEPTRVVLPLGTGGTAAGLALGFAMARMRTRVVGVRVVPRVVANVRRIYRLAGQTARFAEELSKRLGLALELPRPGGEAVRVEHLFYGGAYGRETAEATAAAQRFGRHHAMCRLDATYSAKAFAAALAACDGQPTLFWLTFDGRWLTGTEGLGARG